MPQPNNESPNLSREILWGNLKITVTCDQDNVVTIEIPDYVRMKFYPPRRGTTTSEAILGYAVNRVNFVLNAADGLKPDVIENLIQMYLGDLGFSLIKET